MHRKISVWLGIGALAVSVHARNVDANIEPSKVAAIYCQGKGLSETINTKTSDSSDWKEVDSSDGTPKTRFYSTIEGLSLGDADLRIIAVYQSSVAPEVDYAPSVSWVLLTTRPNYKSPAWFKATISRLLVPPGTSERQPPTNRPIDIPAKCRFLMPGEKPPELR